MTEAEQGVLCSGEQRPPQDTAPHAWVPGAWLLVPVQPTRHSPGTKRDLPGNPIPDRLHGSS